MSVSISSGLLYPYSHTQPICYHSAQCECHNDDDSIVIDKLEKGFVLNFKDKEYACESLHSIFEVMKRLLKDHSKAE
jgi:hypothetical protein